MSDIPTPIRVVLPARDIYWAGRIGFLRNYLATVRNSEDKAEFTRPAGALWTNHIEGAMAELAVANLLELPWLAGVDTYHVADIEPDIEVRWSPKQHLKVRPDDNGRVVAVTGQCPNYVVVGWMPAEMAKQPKWHCLVAPPCYFVPYEDLLDIHTINELKHKLNK